VGEENFCLSVLAADLKANRGTDPLSLILDKVHVVFKDEPGDLLVGHELGDSKFAVVDVLDTVRKLVTDILSTALDVFTPPSENVVDGVEDLFWVLVNPK
jgi:hypothetical protein